MQQPQRRGVLMISIDLPEQTRSVEKTRSLEAATRQLVALMDRRQIGATWALDAPAQSRATEIIRNAQVHHEIAVLGDATWVGARAGRTRFARGLAQRLESCRQADLDIATLALRDTELRDHLDLLVKHKISVVRSDASTARPQRLQPRSLRFGVWEAPVSVRLPVSTAWLDHGSWTARRAVGRAIADCQLVHLGLDVDWIAEDVKRRLNVVDRILRFAQSRKTRGCLSVKTLSRLVSQLSRARTTVPARSILRAA